MLAVVTADVQLTPQSPLQLALNDTFYTQNFNSRVRIFSTVKLDWLSAEGKDNFIYAEVPKYEGEKESWNLHTFSTFEI